MKAWHPRCVLRSVVARASKALLVCDSDHFRRQRTFWRLRWGRLVRLSLIADLSDLALLLVDLSSWARHYCCIWPKRPIASGFDPLWSCLRFCNKLRCLSKNSARRSSYKSWSTKVLHHNITTITLRYNLQMHLMILIVILQVLWALMLVLLTVMILDILHRLILLLMLLIIHIIIMNIMVKSRCML